MRAARLQRQNTDSDALNKNAPSTNAEGAFLLFIRCEDQTCTTSLTPGIWSLMARSIPIFRVIVDIGQLPQAPFSRTFTIPSSVTSTSSTSPPSACRPGRTCSRTFSTSSFIAHSPFVCGVAQQALLFRQTGLGQVLRLHDLIQLFHGHQFLLQYYFTDAPTAGDRFLGDGSRRVVADVRSQHR